MVLWPKICGFEVAWFAPTGRTKLNMSEIPRPDSTPPPDLSREREEVLRSFRRSAALTERFMDEYARTRARLLEIETENEVLRQRLDGDTVAVLGSPPRSSREPLPRSNRDDSRLTELEDEFAHLASLFVASNQLQASLTTRGVLRRLRDMLGQLIGARAYALFFLSADGTTLRPVLSEGVGPNQLAAVPVAGTSFGQVLSGQVSRIDEDRDANQLDFEAPPALIPLVADDRPVGLVVIYGLLPQKARFSRTDFELFRLLGHHAAPALVGASLFEQSGHRLPGAEIIETVST